MPWLCRLIIALLSLALIGLDSTEPGYGKHRALPYRDNTAIHDGRDANQCSQCRDTMAKIARDGAPTVNHVRVALGDRIRVSERLSSDPEWGTVTSMRVNSNTGEVWVHSFDFGDSRVITQDEIAEIEIG
jgi:hypothetical protein